MDTIYWVFGATAIQGAVWAVGTSQDILEEVNALHKSQARRLAVKWDNGIPIVSLDGWTYRGVRTSYVPESERPVPPCPPAPDKKHYAKLKIEPFEYSMANELDAMQHTAIKYITRFRDKNGIEDLRKAIDTLNRLIKWEQEHATKK